jgi:multidrug efflux pump subunit AcrB
LISLRWFVIGGYVAASAAVVLLILPRLGQEIFPVVDAGQFRLRVRAPDGTHIARTERYATDVLDLVKQEVGAENVALTLGYVGMIHSNFPVNAVYQWSRGPEEAILYVDLKDGSGVDAEKAKESLRARVAQAMP